MISMKVGTIGSGFIVDMMISAMKQTEGIEVVACYSRSEEKAKEFAAKHELKKYYFDLDEMMKDDEIDTIYVASPNSLHYPQSKKALLAGKNVINEKPFAPTLAECDDLFKTAKENNVYIFEAITNQHLPNYKIIKEHLQDVGNIRLVQCNYSQYSSRYDKYKNHEVTNAFDPAFNGGAIMDINVYCIHFVVGLFGKPESTLYTATKGFNGVDTNGVVVMKYPNFIATCIGAKDSSSSNFAYIQGDAGSIRVTGSGANVCSDVDFVSPKGDMNRFGKTIDATVLSIEQKMHMTYECEVFQKIFAAKDDAAYQALCDETRIVVEILENSHKQID